MRGNGPFIYLRRPFPFKTNPQLSLPLTTPHPHGTHHTTPQRTINLPSCYWIRVVPVGNIITGPQREPPSFRPLPRAVAPQTLQSLRVQLLLLQKPLCRLHRVSKRRRKRRRMAPIIGSIGNQQTPSSTRINADPVKIAPRLPARRLKTFARQDCGRDETTTRTQCILSCPALIKLLETTSTIRERMPLFIMPVPRTHALLPYIYGNAHICAWFLLH